MEKIVIIILQNTEKVSKRKTASKKKKICTSQTNPIYETEIANSGQLVVRVCKVAVTKN